MIRYARWKAFNGRMVFTILLLGGLGAGTARGQSILYVDDAAAPGGNGASWATAYRFLRDAIDAAFVPGNDITEIRVARGVYRTDRDESNPLGTSDRNAVFWMVNDVQIKGGYAGIGAPAPDARDVALYETILSADLNGDDEPGFANNVENSYHVVSASGTSGPNRLLDGFTITGGNANGAGTSPSNGGGVIVWSSARNVTLSNCTIVGNRAADHGGGIYNTAFANSAPKLIDCTISGNETDSLGGGMYCDNRSEERRVGKECRSRWSPDH